MPSAYSQAPSPLPGRPLPKKGRPLRDAQGSGRASFRFPLSFRRKALNRCVPPGRVTSTSTFCPTHIPPKTSFPLMACHNCEPSRPTRTSGLAPPSPHLLNKYSMLINFPVPRRYHAAIFRAHGHRCDIANILHLRQIIVTKKVNNTSVLTEIDQIRETVLIF